MDELQPPFEGTGSMEHMEEVHDEMQNKPETIMNGPTRPTNVIRIRNRSEIEKDESEDGSDDDEDGDDEPDELSSPPVTFPASSTQAIIESCGVSNVNPEIPPYLGDAALKQLRHVLVLASQMASHDKIPGIRVSDFSNAEKYLNSTKYHRTSGGNASNFLEPEYKVNIRGLLVRDSGPIIRTEVTEVNFNHDEDDDDEESDSTYLNEESTVSAPTLHVQRLNFHKYQEQDELRERCNIVPNIRIEIDKIKTKTNTVVINLSSNPNINIDTSTQVSEEVASSRKTNTQDVFLDEWEEGDIWEDVEIRTNYHVEGEICSTSTSFDSNVSSAETSPNPVGDEAIYDEGTETDTKPNEEYQNANPFFENFITDETGIPLTNEVEVEVSSENEPNGVDVPELKNSPSPEKQNFEIEELMEDYSSFVEETILDCSGSDEYSEDSSVSSEENENDLEQMLEDLVDEVDIEHFMEDEIIFQNEGIDKTIDDGFNDLTDADDHIASVEVSTSNQLLEDDAIVENGDIDMMSDMSDSDSVHIQANEQDNEIIMQNGIAEDLEHSDEASRSSSSSYSSEDDSEYDEIDEEEKPTLAYEWKDYLKVLVEQFFALNDEDSNSDSSSLPSGRNNNEGFKNPDSDFYGFVEDIAEHGLLPVLSIWCDFCTDFLNCKFGSINESRLHGILSVFEAVLKNRLSECLTSGQMIQTFTVLIEILVIPPTCDVQRHLISTFGLVLKKAKEDSLLEMVGWVCSFITETLSLVSTSCFHSWNIKCRIFHCALLLANELEDLGCRFAYKFQWHVYVLEVLKGKTVLQDNLNELEEGQLLNSVLAATEENLDVSDVTTNKNSEGASDILTVTKTDVFKPEVQHDSSELREISPQKKYLISSAGAKKFYSEDIFIQNSPIPEEPVDIDGDLTSSEVATYDEPSSVVEEVVESFDPYGLAAKNLTVDQEALINAMVMKSRLSIMTILREVCGNEESEIEKRRLHSSETKQSGGSNSETFNAATKPKGDCTNWDIENAILLFFKSFFHNYSAIAPRSVLAHVQSVGSSYFGEKMTQFVVASNAFTSCAQVKKGNAKLKRRGSVASH